jgi:integrase
MALSQLAISKAKPKDKPYLLADGGGLHLRIDASGSKLWRFRYRFGGKANMMSLGPFPVVSLKEAREKRDQMKKQIAAGINPSLRKKLDRISAGSPNTFGAIADEYIANLKANDAAPIRTMSRPGDVRHMKRNEVDFEKRLWRIPAERMKMRRAHDVPLSRQSLVILKAVWPLNENHELVFPSLRAHKKPLSENAFNSVLRSMGYRKDQATSHGFGATANTILNERGYSADVIEAALAHQDENEMRRIYNRALYLPERKKLMQEGADLLEDFRRQQSISRAA